MSKYFTLVRDHPNVEVGHQDHDPLVAMVSADADVVQLAALRTIREY